MDGARAILFHDVLSRGGELIADEERSPAPLLVGKASEDCQEIREAHAEGREVAEEGKEQIGGSGRRKEVISSG